MSSELTPLPENLSQQLRPITLPIPNGFKDLTQLIQKRQALEEDIITYIKLENKLDTITDEVSWEAMIPVGSLAFFPGQLVHTNDILVPTSSPSINGSSISTESSAAVVEDGEKELKTAKKAKIIAKGNREDLEFKLELLIKLITSREAELKKLSIPGLDDTNTINEKGEVLTEEGLPIMDICEYIEDEPESSTSSTTTKTSTPIASTSSLPIPSSTPVSNKPRMGGLIQRGGKQTILKPKIAAVSTTSSSTLPPSKGKGINPQNESIFEQIEREEAEEEAKAKLEEKKDVTSAIPSTSTSSSIVLSSASSSLIPKSVPPPKKALSGFSSGFLTKKPKSTSTSTPSLTPPTSLPPSKTPIPSVSNSTESEPRFEPKHHILPAAKSIYRPTPPSSRPNSPKPSEKKVVFNLPPPGTEEESPKIKKGKEVIILGGPEEKIVEEEGKVIKKEPFQRPLKEVVVERPVQAPTAPRPRQPSTKFTKKEGDGLPIRTLGMAPKSTSTASTSTSTSNPTSKTSTSVSSTPLATPIHTLSLSTKSNSLPSGHLSIANYLPETDPHSDSDEHSASELRPSLTSDSENSDSSGFYGSDIDDEDDDDEYEFDDDDEIDIDGALHNREVALEYHRLRMNVGAGAGTGPLGGDRDSEAYDSWNQENVPNSATQQGRTPGSHSSRFRTGRLESAQMIIPSLLQEHIRTDLNEVSDEDSNTRDDGLTNEERENIRIRLEELAGRVDQGGRSDMNGKRISEEEEEEEEVKAVVEKNKIQEPTQSISQMMENLSIPSKNSPSSSDQIGKRMATPITVPTNPPIARMRESEQQSNMMMGGGIGSNGGVKKMSRFKATQLGLEPEI